MPARRGDLLAAAFALLSAASVARAQVPFPSVLDQIVGVRMDGSRALVFETDGGTRVEFGDMELFGVSGLRLSGARATGRAGGLPFGVEVSRLGAPVGSHARITGRLGVETSRWRTAVRAGVESLALAGIPAESALVTGVVSGVDVGNTSLLVDVESVAYTESRATFMTAAVAGKLASRATLVAAMRYDGAGAMAAGVAAIVPVHAALVLATGYDDGTETARAGAFVTVGGWTLAAGAFRHPVLGMSQGVSVSVTW